MNALWRITFPDGRFGFWRGDEVQYVLQRRLGPGTLKGGDLYGDDVPAVLDAAKRPGSAARSSLWGYCYMDYIGTGGTATIEPVEGLQQIVVRDRYILGRLYEPIES